MGIIARVEALRKWWHLYAGAPAEESVMPAAVPSLPRIPLRASCALLAFQVQDAVERFSAMASAANDPNIPHEQLIELRTLAKQVSEQEWAALSELMKRVQEILDGRGVEEEEPPETHAVLETLIETFSPHE